jgi:hypothetical protein
MISSLSTYFLPVSVSTTRSKRQRDSTWKHHPKHPVRQKVNVLIKSRRQAVPKRVWSAHNYGYSQHESNPPALRQLLPLDRRSTSSDNAAKDILSNSDHIKMHQGSPSPLDDEPSCMTWMRASAGDMSSSCMGPDQMVQVYIKEKQGSLSIKRCFTNKMEVFLCMMIPSTVCEAYVTSISLLLVPLTNRLLSRAASWNQIYFCGTFWY